LSSRVKDSKQNRIAALLVGLSLVGILMIGAPPGRAATAATTYDNVQLSIHTTNATFAGTYTVTAFNSTGYPLVTYETPYPAASFELPSASYIFTVSASTQTIYACPLGSGVSTASGSATATAASGASSAGTGIVLPICYPGYPQDEYGFAVQQVSGPTSITISTKPDSSFPTTTITVHVHYVNGTAAMGSNLYASVLGGDWYGFGGATPLNMSATTGPGGSAQIVVPAAPVDVTAWSWIPVNLPASQTTTVVNIGGEKVNVTVNWEPSYVGLAGSVLIVPPQTSGSITLHSQQSSYWVTPEGATSGGGSVSTGLATGEAVTNGPDLVPASISSQQSTGQSGASTVVSTSTVVERVATAPGTVSTIGSPAANYDSVLLTIVGALALALAATSLIIVKRRPGPDAGSGQHAESADSGVHVD
jgi:hypothetical protein